MSDSLALSHCMVVAENIMYLLSYFLAYNITPPEPFNHFLGTEIKHVNKECDFQIDFLTAK